MAPGRWDAFGARWNAGRSSYSLAAYCTAALHVATRLGALRGIKRVGG